MSVFTDPSPAAITPVVTATVEGEGGNPGLSGVVESWETTRELTGSTLPGSIRGSSGLSIGSGSLVARNDNPVVRNPWSTKGDRITHGSSVSLLATSDDGETRDLGDWLVDKASGSLRSEAVALSLIEGQFRGRGPERAVKNLLPGLFPWSLQFPGAVTDPSWTVDVLARQCGYYSTPAPAPSTVGSQPAVGGIWDEVDTATPSTFTFPTGWGAFGGAAGVVGAHEVSCGLGTRSYGFVQGFIVPISEWRMHSNQPLFHTVNAIGVETISMLGNGTDIAARIDANAATLSLRVASTDPWVTVSYVPGLDPNHPQRVQVEMARAGTPDSTGAGTFGTTRARIRSSHTAPWSDWATVTGSRQAEVAVLSTISGADGSSFCGWQISTAADPELWAPTNAIIDRIGGSIVSPFFPADLDPWSAIQQYVASWSAAAHVDRERRFRLLNRRHLSGAASAGTVLPIIEAGSRVVDLPWSVESADVADRLEVTYRPVTAVTRVREQDAAGVSQLAWPILWETSEVIRLGPRERREILMDIDTAGFEIGTGRTQNIGTYWAAEFSELVNERMTSTWSANSAEDGTGALPSDGAIRAITDRVSAGRIRLTIVNMTGGPLYLVNREGRPHLRMRGWVRFDQAETVTIAHGLPAGEALNPMTVDLGRHVQQPVDAEDIARQLWALVRRPSVRLSSIEIIPNADLDIGQVWQLRHPRSGLDTKALIVKDARRGSAGAYSQTVDVVLLRPTYADLKALYAGRTYADLEAAWAGATYSDMTDDPLKGA